VSEIEEGKHSYLEGPDRAVLWYIPFGQAFESTRIRPKIWPPQGGFPLACWNAIQKDKNR